MTYLIIFTSGLYASNQKMSGYQDDKNILMNDFSFHFLSNQSLLQKSLEINIILLPLSPMGGPQHYCYCSGTVIARTLKFWTFPKTKLNKF